MISQEFWIILAFYSTCITGNMHSKYWQYLRQIDIVCHILLFLWKLLNHLKQLDTFDNFNLMHSQMINTGFFPINHYSVTYVLPCPTGEPRWPDSFKHCNSMSTTVCRSFVSSVSWFPWHAASYKRNHTFSHTNKLKVNDKDYLL